MSEWRCGDLGRCATPHSLRCRALACWVVQRSRPLAGPRTALDHNRDCRSRPRHACCSLSYGQFGAAHRWTMLN